VVDLRGANLPPTDHRLDLKLGVGHALLLVDERTCVASAADVGLGAVQVFDQDSVGADLHWDDQRDAPARTPRVVVAADIGIGAFEVDHERGDGWPDDGFHRGDDADRNGCEGDHA
jgi:hypothetical protein